MTQEIIEMARQAGAISYKLPNYLEPSGILFSQIELEAFAKLVAAKEREACAKVCEEQYEYYGHDHIFAKAIRARGKS